MILRDTASEPPKEPFLKIVADIKRGILSCGCELHVDCAEELLEDGSESADLWGANVYTDTHRTEYTSMINIRPQAGNRSMEVQDPAIRKAIDAVVEKLLFRK